MPRWVYRPLSPRQVHRDVNVVVPVAPTGAQTILPDSIASDEAWGTHQLNFTLSPDSTGSNEAFGTLTLMTYILPTSFGSDEGWQNPQVNFIILPDATGSNEAWGS